MSFKKYAIQSLFCTLLLGLTACSKYERNNPNDLLNTDGTPNLAIAGYAVKADDNNDANLQKRETATLNILVSNNGTKLAQIKSINFTSNSSKLSVLSFTLLNNALSLVNKQTAIGELKIKIADDATAGEKLTCNATITDKSGAVFNSVLTMVISEVKPSALDITQLTIRGFDENDGNRYEYAKGYIPEVSLMIQNKGNVAFPSGQIKMTLTSLNPTYPFSYSHTDYISALSSNQSEGFSFEMDCLPNNIPNNGTLKMRFTISDELGGTLERDIDVVMKPSSAKLEWDFYLWAGDPFPGEGYELNATVLNSGTRILKFSQSNVKITSTSPYLSNLSFTLNQSRLNPGEQIDDFFTIYATVSSNCPSGSQIPIKVELLPDHKCATPFTTTVYTDVQ